jgi:hypothetical protein
VENYVTGSPVEEDCGKLRLQKADVRKTAEEWVDQTIGERLRRESASALLDKISAKNLRDMANLGVKPADIEREIADYRRDG